MKSDESDNQQRAWEAEFLESEVSRSFAALQSLRAEVVKYLMIASGGLCVSLATWLLSCLSAAASSAQREIAPCLVRGITFGAIGLIAAVILPWIDLGAMRWHAGVRYRWRKRMDTDKYSKEHYYLGKGLGPAMFRLRRQMFLWRILCFGSVICLVIALLSVRAGVLHTLRQ